MYKLGFFFLSLMILFSGCSKISTDPSKPFLQVQENVSKRTGHIIEWQKNEECLCKIEGYLNHTLRQELTLDKVVEVVLLNNQKLKASYEKLGIAQAELVQAVLLKNPIFSLSLRYENLIHSANILEMGVVQNFLDILLKPLKKKLACAELALVKSQVAAEVIDLIAETKIAYHSLKTSDQILMMNRDLLEVTDAAYDLSKRLYEAGNMTHLDFTIEHSNYEQMKTDVLVSELHVFEARERLNRLMGLLEGNIDWKLANEVMEISNEQINIDCIETHALANSLDLQIRKERMRATAIRLGIQINEIVFPEMTFGPDSERDPGSPWYIGPQFSIGLPIFDTGYAKKASGYSELKKQWNEYKALAVEVKSHARLASFRLLNAFKQYRSFEEVIIPLKKEITKETFLQYNAMQLGLFELLLMKQNQIRAKIKSMSFYRDYWTARAEVEALLSGKMIQKNKRMDRNED